MKQKKTIRSLWTLTAGMLTGARRVAMLLLTLLLTMTAQTAWADSWIDAGGTGGSGTNENPYYVNMPATGEKTVTVPSGVTSFKVYDNGGSNGYYSDNCKGTLVINAPSGYGFTLSGRVRTQRTPDYLSAYDGNAVDESKRILSFNSYGSWSNIYPSVTTVSESLTLYFESDDSNNSEGLDLTITLVGSEQLSRSTITMSDHFYWNNGNAIDIAYTVKGANGSTLTKGTDYTETIKKGGNVVSDDVKDVGDYTLTISGMGSYYKGEKTVNFTVAEQNCLYGVLSGESSNKTMTLKYGNYFDDPADATTNMKKIFYPGNSSWWNRSDGSYNKTIVIDASCQNYQGTSLQSLFNNWEYMTSITGLENLNYHNTVTDMSYMFNGCKHLTTLDLSGLNTASVTNMSYMFEDCELLASIDFGDGTKFNTSEVNNMLYMFLRCEAITELDLSAFSTPKLSTLNGMFSDCSHLQTIIVSSGWSVAGVSYSTNTVFEYCSVLVGEQGTTLDENEVSHNRAHIDGGTSNPGYLTGRYTITYNTNGGTMPTATYVTSFTGKDNVVIDLPTPTRNGYAFAGWFENSELTGTAITSYPAGTRGDKTLYAKWSQALYAVVNGTTMTLKCGDPTNETGSVTYNNMSSWNDSFKNTITNVVVDASCQNYIGTTLSCLFSEFENLTTITGLDNLNTENVTDMRDMFEYCNSLTTLDVSSFNTSKVTDMSYMFSYCWNLTTLDLSSFNTAKVTNMRGLFYCSDKLTSIDLRNFNTSEVTAMDNMFGICEKLETIIVGEGWNTAKVTTSDNMFKNCTMLTGQEGTKCDGTNNIDGTYARVDVTGTPGTPGYLSLGLNEATGIVNAAAYEGKKAQFTRTFTSGKASTVCLPFSFTPDANIGTFYTLFAIDKSTSPYWTVTMQEAATTAPLAANTPYLLMATGTGALNFSGNVSSVATEMKSADVADPVVSGGKWNLIGTYSDISWTSDGPNAADLGSVYGFAANDYGTVVHAGDFVKATSGAGISPFRAYLKYTAPSSSARAVTRGVADILPDCITVRLIGANGEATAIGTMDTKTGEISFDGWYTLDGSRLSGKPSAKGVYINNGKKIVIK